MSIPSLKGKHILIGVTAGIAAYKIPPLLCGFEKKKKEGG